MAQSRRIGLYVRVPASTVREIARRAKAGSTKTKKVRHWEVVADAIKVTTPNKD